ncbi:MAG: hypothetical protein WBW92_09170 [Rhodanobacteraceae bacterium]
MQGASGSIETREESHLDYSARELFRRRYGSPAPDFPYHVVTWLLNAEDDTGVPACYIHFTAHGDALLGGGACVDPRAMRRMPSGLRQSIKAQGGLYQLSLAWSLQHFSGRFKAVFGYCGDALAERVDRAVGFVDTGHKHLLVYWLDSCDPATRARLIAEAHAVGPF